MEKQRVKSESKVQKYEHGGDWAGFETKYGCPPLDFSASISPLGVPDGVRRAMETAIACADRYPDPLCRALRKQIAARESVTPDMVLCGGGAAELIFRAVWAKRPRQALVAVPAFAEYEAALETVDCQVERYALPAEGDFALDEGFLSAIVPGIDMVFLCQPNNPTGRTVPRPLLTAILARCRAVGALLVLDECFVDFLDRPEEHTLAGALERSPDLLILRSFTKMYALAGVRLGYCLGDPTLLDAMAAAGPPWSVSTLAQAAGLAALEEDGYMECVRALVRTERPRLDAELSELGLRVIPGEANFLLFHSPVSLDEALGRQGILLRNCGNYPGLDRSWYRVAVRTRADNGRLIRSIREVLFHG